MWVEPGAAGQRHGAQLRGRAAAGRRVRGLRVWVKNGWLRVGVGQGCNRMVLSDDVSVLLLAGGLRRVCVRIVGFWASRVRVRVRVGPRCKWHDAQLRGCAAAGAWVVGKAY